MAVVSRMPESHTACKGIMQACAASILLTNATLFTVFNEMERPELDVRLTREGQTH